MPTQDSPNIASFKVKVSQWEKNIKSLKTTGDNVGVRAKPEYERLLDLLTAKLCVLKENVGKLQDNRGNRRTRAAVHKTLNEIEQAFASALSKLKGSDLLD